MTLEDKYHRLLTAVQELDTYLDFTSELLEPGETIIISDPSGINKALQTLTDILNEERHECP